MSNMKSPLPQCASMVRIQNILSGKWKITILWYISEYEIQRFGELRRRLGDITQSTLTKQLRELEQDGNSGESQGPDRCAFVKEHRVS